MQSLTRSTTRKRHPGHSHNHIAPTKYNKEQHQNQITDGTKLKLSAIHKDHAQIFTDGSHDPETNTTGLGVYYLDKHNKPINTSKTEHRNAVTISSPPWGTRQAS